MAQRLPVILGITGRLRKFSRAGVKEAMHLDNVMTEFENILNAVEKDNSIQALRLMDDLIKQFQELQDPPPRPKKSHRAKVLHGARVPLRKPLLHRQPALAGYAMA